jgi:hypothetical protein
LGLALDMRTDESDGGNGVDVQPFWIRRVPFGQVKTNHKALMGPFVIRVPYCISEAPFAENNIGPIQKSPASILVVAIVTGPKILLELEETTFLQDCLQPMKELQVVTCNDHSSAR